MSVHPGTYNLVSGNACSLTTPDLIPEIENHASAECKRIMERAYNFEQLNSSSLKLLREKTNKDLDVLTEFILEVISKRRNMSDTYHFQEIASQLLIIQFQIGSNETLFKRIKGFTTTELDSAYIINIFTEQIQQYLNLVKFNERLVNANSPTAFWKGVNSEILAQIKDIANSYNKSSCISNNYWIPYVQRISLKIYLALITVLTNKMTTSITNDITAEFIRRSVSPNDDLLIKYQMIHLNPRFFFLMIYFIGNSTREPDCFDPYMILLFTDIIRILKTMSLSNSLMEKKNINDYIMKLLRDSPTRSDFNRILEFEDLIIDYGGLDQSVLIIILLSITIADTKYSLSEFKRLLSNLSGYKNFIDIYKFIVKELMNMDLGVREQVYYHVLDFGLFFVRIFYMQVKENKNPKAIMKSIKQWELNRVTPLSEELFIPNMNNLISILKIVID